MGIIRKYRKSIMLITVIIMSLSGLAVNAASGWGHDSNGWYYYYSSGKYYSGQWAKINNNWYYFTNDGYMDYSEYRDGCWLNADGTWNKAYSGGTWKSNKKGWWYEDGSWYAFDQWLWIDGKCYYFASDGYMESNCYRDGCWIDSSGAWDSSRSGAKWEYDGVGFRYVEGGSYPTGKFVRIDGNYYYFDNNGYWKTSSESGESSGSNGESDSNSWNGSNGWNDSNNENDSNSENQSGNDNYYSEDWWSEDDGTGEENEVASQIFINGEPASDMEVTLYSLPAREGIDMPDGYETTMKLDVTGYTQSLYFYSDIDRYIDGYWTPSNNYIQLEEGNYLPVGKSDYDYDETITIIADGQEFDLKIHYISYERIYFEERIAAIASSITNDGMSDYDKMEAIVKYVAENYDYNYLYSGYKDELLNGGGDCWANSELIVALLNEVGIECRTHRDPFGTGSHENVVANVSGTVYELEAGYGGTAPRTYDITDIGEGLSCCHVFGDDGSTTIGYSLIDYEGFGGEDVVLPETVNGLPLLSTWPNAFYYLVHYTDTRINSIYISKSIKEISAGTFYGLDDLKSIKVDPASQYFVAENNVLYSKDKSVLYYLAEGQFTEFTVPESVVEIKGYTAAWDESFEKLTLGSNVKTIGKCAFWATQISELELPEGIETIGDGAFSETNIKKLVIPDSVKSIGEGAFESYSMDEVTVLSKDVQLGKEFVYKDTVIKGYKGSTAETFANENGNTFVEIK